MQYPAASMKTKTTRRGMPMQAWPRIIVLGLSLASFHPALFADESSSLSRLSVGQTLEDFFTAAIDYSPQLKIAVEGLNIGRARKRQAQGQLQPQINANANITDNARNSFDPFGRSITDEFIGQRFSLSVQQTLFNWQAFAAQRRASRIENQREAEYYYQLSLLLTDVADRYLGVLLAQDAITSVESEVEAVSSQLEQIQSLFDLQLAQITDLRQAEASLIATEAERLSLQSDLAVAEERLRSITGIEVGELYTLQEGAELPSAQSSMQFWVESAKSNNQQIKARSYALEAADEGISESKGAYMPRVNFFATRQESNVGFDNRFLGDTENTYLGLDVTIPIYAGGSNRARENEARAQRNIAESELRQIELETSASVREAFLRVQSSSLLTEAAQRLVLSTRVAAEAAQEGFALGTVTNVDVLNAVRNQFQAEREFQRARYEQINYLLQLKREAGTLTSDDLVQISKLMVPTQL